MTTYLISTESAIGYGLEVADSPEQALDMLAKRANLYRHELDDDCQVYAVPDHLVAAAEQMDEDTPADDLDFAAIVAANA